MHSSRAVTLRSRVCASLSCRPILIESTYCKPFEPHPLLPNVLPQLRPAPPGSSARLGSQAFIRWSVERRLRMVTPYLSRWPEALGLLALPQNAPAALRNFGALLDDVWYHAGDRSSDVSGGQVVR